MFCASTLVQASSPALVIPVVSVFLLTVLGGEDPDDSAERAFAQAVVHAHLHLKRGLRRHAVVAVNVSGGVGRGHRRLDPGGAAERAERQHVAEALAGVLLLWNGLTAAGGKVFNLCLIFGATSSFQRKE